MDIKNELLIINFNILIIILITSVSSEGMFDAADELGWQQG